MQENRENRARFVKLRQKYHYLFCLSFSAEFWYFSVMCMLTASNVGCLSVQTLLYFLPSTHLLSHVRTLGCNNFMPGRNPVTPECVRPKQQSWGMENLLSEGILRSNHLGSNWFSLYKWSRRFTVCCHKLWFKRIHLCYDTLWYQW